MSPVHHCNSPFKYFEDDWPTKSGDEAFVAFIHDLDQSQTLSGMSDFLDSDSEDEEVLNIDDSNNVFGPEDGTVTLSLALLTEEDAQKFSEPVLGRNISNDKERTERANSVPKTKSRSRQRKMIREEVAEVKRQKFNTKKVVLNIPTEQKSRRARKPNKRYSNDEFTSHFDYEDIESPEEEHAEVLYYES